MTLEEKQQSFEYRSPADLFVHGEPFSPAEWNKTLETIGGTCPLGDARLRIVWGGTAKKKGFIQTDTRSAEAMVIKYRAEVPKTRNLVGFTYFGHNGHVVRVARADHVPEDKIAMPIIEEQELGMLRWMFERKFTVDELVAMQMAPDPRSEAVKTYGVKGGRRYIAPTDPRGEYIGLYPLQTPDGKYWEPTAEWFDLLWETEKVNREVTVGDRMVMLDKALEDIETRERKAKEYAAEQEDILFEETLIETEKAAQGQVIFDQHI